MNKEEILEKLKALSDIDKKLRDIKVDVGCRHWYLYSLLGSCITYLSSSLHDDWREIQKMGYNKTFIGK